MAEADDLVARAAVNIDGLGFPAERAFSGAYLDENFARLLERLIGVSTSAQSSAQAADVVRLAPQWPP
jgi:hypothetical protein